MVGKSQHVTHTVFQPVCTILLWWEANSWHQLCYFFTDVFVLKNTNLSTSFYLSPSYWANLKYDHTESSENKLVEALQKNNIWTIQIQFDSVSCQTQLNTKVNKKWPLSPDRRNFVWKQVIGVERPPIYLQFFSFLKRSIVVCWINIGIPVKSSQRMLLIQHYSFSNAARATIICYE